MAFLLGQIRQNKGKVVRVFAMRFLNLTTVTFNTHINQVIGISIDELSNPDLQLKLIRTNTININYAVNLATTEQN